MPIPIPRSLEGVLQQLRQDVDSLLLRRQNSGGAPAGSVQMFAGATAPPGYAVCDGSAISRADNPSLFAAIGTTYGSGDGTTTFNLPNLKGRVPVGQDPAQSEFDTVGEAGGEKAHALSDGEMPAHAHSLTGGAGHAMAWGQGNIAFDPAPVAYLGTPSGNALGTVQNDWNSTRDAGGGQAHNNLQPYLVMNYVIKLG